MVDGRLCVCLFFFFKQKTAYEMRISDWSSDVCSSDLFDLHTDGLQCVLLWPDLRVRAWSGAARGARDGERDTAVRAEPGRAGPRPAAVRHGVGNAEANCRRRERAIPTTPRAMPPGALDRKSTRLNSSH